MSERQSPPTERVVQVLNLFADHPDRRWTLTGVCDHLGLTKATCLGILGVLSDSGFLTRDATKTYGLGPALLRLGWAAEVGLASLDVVRPHLATLHERTGLACVLVSVHDEHLVVVDRLGAGHGDHRDLVGDRFPFAPPLGLINTAWADDATVEAWLARPPLLPLGADADVVRALVAQARRSGYIVERRAGAGGPPNTVLANLVASDLPRSVVRELLDRLSPVNWSEYLPMLPEGGDGELAVWGVSAPIRDRRGAQRYTLSVLADTTPVPVRTVRAWAAELVSTARAASCALGWRAAGEPDRAGPTPV